MKNPTSPIVVQRPHELSVQWAQRIVNRWSAHASVFDVSLQSIDVGTSTRLRIEVHHDAPKHIPSRWFIKTPSLALKSRMITALPRFLQKEISFYRSFADSVPLKLPRILAAETRFGFGSTLVMSDLVEHNFKPGSVADTLDFEQAKRVIAHLAQLHGHYWNKTELFAQHQWLNGFSYQMENHMGVLMAYPLMKRGLFQAGSGIPKKLHRPALAYARNRREVKRFLNQGIKTLVHYDCHPGNIFWAETEPGFLDWQLVRVGEGIGDVAYFLATALEPNQRRKNENNLLNHYVEKLTESGVEGLNEQQLFRRYQAHLVYPFEAMTVTLGIGGMMQRDHNLELIKRAASAVEDHDSFSLI